MAITIYQSKIARKIKLTMRISKFIPDLIRPSKYFQVDLRKILAFLGTFSTGRDNLRTEKLGPVFLL